MSKGKQILITEPILPNKEALFKELEDIYNSKILTNHGPKHIALEKALTEYLKIPNITLYNNATIALLIAFKALELKGEVITTPFTFSATIHALKWCGLTPVFCDIDEKSMCIDADKIESLITDKTSAILGVHVYGIPCAVDKIQKIANKHDLKVVYDAAHAFKTEINGESIANYGDLSIFSFHATKLFNTIEGGAIAYKDRTLKDKLYLLKNFGIKNEEEIILPGINGKMNEVQAIFGLLNLKLVDEERRKRKLIAEQYKKYLENVDGIRLPEFPSGASNSYQYFPIVIDGFLRDEIFQKLRDNNIYARKYFYPLCSNYECYRDLPSSKNLPIANKIADQVLCLPFYGSLNKDEIKMICDFIKS